MDSRTGWRLLCMSVLVAGGHQIDGLVLVLVVVVAALVLVLVVLVLVLLVLVLVVVVVVDGGAGGGGGSRGDWGWTSVRQRSGQKLCANLVGNATLP